MKVVVIGGSGLIGTRLVEKLRTLGHESIPASPTSGVNTFSGAGVDAVLKSAEVVIDVINPRSFEDLLNFFETSTRTLLTAEAGASIKHHVLLSIVGADRIPDSPYMMAKVMQENVVQTSGVPFTIVRSTQFFEFLGPLADINTRQGLVSLPPVFIQPVAADDVADMLSNIAASEAVNNTLEFSGPQRFRLDKLIQIYLKSIGDSREVITDPSALYFGGRLEENSLMPAEHAGVGSTNFEQWLDRNKDRLSPGQSSG